MPDQMNSELDNSWIDHDTEDGNSQISWAEDSEPSDIDQSLPVPHISQTPPRQRRATPQHTHSSRSSNAEEPQFIMPSVSSNSPVRRSPLTKRVPSRNTPLRDVRYTSNLSHQDQLPPPPRYRAQSSSDRVTDIALGTSDFVLDIIGTTLQTLKKPISWILAAYLLGGLLVLVQNLLTSSIYSALSPVCRIPGVSLLRLSVCQSPYASQGQPTASKTLPPVDPEFDALMTIQGKFETILEDTAAGVTLPMDMKRSELSIRDLRQVVSFSSIPSKNELVLEFDGFIETAREASLDLQKFNSHVGRTVDSVLSINRWTQRVLDEISLKTLQSSGPIVDFINNRLLAPFQPVEFTESRLLEQYLTHTRHVSDEIEGLITEAQAVLQVLLNLEDRLDIIHGISLRDNIAAAASRDEVLAQLWTIVGGNRGTLAKVDKQMKLLDRVGEYRKLALAHVAGTILKLQAIGTELEELRTRVSGAAVAHDRGIKSVPLSVHVENIRLGIERLEGQRDMARDIQKGQVKKILDKAEATRDREKPLVIDA